MTYDINSHHWDEQAAIYMELFSLEAKGLVVLEHNDWGILEVIPAFSTWLEEPTRDEHGQCLCVLCCRFGHCSCVQCDEPCDEDCDEDDAEEVEYK
jgi:hypothetical protein